MSTTTEVLNLFKYDTETDKKKKFNINQSLNNNWDKIDNFAKEVGKGSGLEICDIGTALYIDETKGLRRRLNGSIVIINDHTQAFLDRLLEIKTTNPDYFTDEETWQTESTLTTDGCVYKFVLNYDDEGTNIVSVRLPKYPDYIEVNNVNTTAQKVSVNVYGSGKALGLTNGSQTGSLSGNTYTASVGAPTFGLLGAGYGTNVGRTAFYNDIAIGVVTSSANSGLKGDVTIPNNVTQAKLKLYYFIQIATGQETENNIVNKLELNNPFSFGMSQYFKGEMNNLSWLRSNGQKNYKAVYSDFYNWVLTNVNNGKDGFKGQKGYCFIDTGSTGYYWWVSTENPVVGAMVYRYEATDNSMRADGILSTLTTNGFTFTSQFEDDTFTVTRDVSKDTEILHPTAWINDYDFVINTTDETFRLPLKNGMEGVFVNGTVPSGYNLYYFVGETMQNSNLANLGRIEETLVNKVDYAQAARASMPSKKYDNLTLLASGQTYIAPADGWVSLSIRSASASTATVNLISNGNGFQTNSYGSNDVECRGFVPVTKGNHFEIYYANVQATPETFRFVYAEGVANT